MINKNIRFHVGKLEKFMKIHNDGLFAITGAKIINEEEMSDRCDFSNWGPISARNDESMNTSSMGAVFFSHVSEIEKFEIVYSFPPHGYIIYLKLKDEQKNQQILSQELPIAAPSFGELMRLLVEWSIVGKEPFNNKDKCSSIALALLQDMGIDEDMKEHILSTYPTMQISKYILSDPNAREQNTDPFKIDNILKDFFLEKSFPIDYLEIDGEVVTKDDPRIAYSAPIEEE